MGWDSWFVSPFKLLLDYASNRIEAPGDIMIRAWRCSGSYRMGEFLIPNSGYTYILYSCDSPTVTEISCLMRETMPVCPETCISRRGSRGLVPNISAPRIKKRSHVTSCDYVHESSLWRTSRISPVSTSVSTIIISQTILSTYNHANSLIPRYPLNQAIQRGWCRAWLKYSQGKSLVS